MSSTSTSTPIKCGINGGGRIGRLVLRNWLLMKTEKIVFTHINDPFADVKTFAYLFRYDTVHGKWAGQVDHDIDAATVTLNGHVITFSKERNPADVKWGSMGIHTVVESSGAFRTLEKASGHLAGGCQRVVISAPAKSDGVAHFVMGVNEKTFKTTDKVISNASCTTNCLAPMCKILNDKWGIESGFLNTIHAYTSTQRTVDLAVPGNLRLGRASAANIIPSSTGAAIAVGLVIPELKGKFDGMSLRVPTPDVSVVDFTVLLSKDATLAEIVTEFKNQAAGSLKGIVAVTEDPVVSMDFRSDPHSCTFDATASMSLPANKRFFKLIGHYDNEWGYSRRLVELVMYTLDVEDTSK